MPRINQPVFAALFLIAVLAGCSDPEPTNPPETPTTAATSTDVPTATIVVTPTATAIPDQIVDAHG
jgi:hypothetical protein